MHSISQVVTYLQQRLLQPLPGAIAHNVLRAQPTGSLLPNFQYTQPPKPGSVLIVLYEENGVLRFPLIKRPEYVGAHSGQVSLPGGKAEPGETAIETALREGEEEIGISPAAVKVVGTLSEFFVVPSNFLVTPVIAYMSTPPVLTPDAREVERVITGNLLELVHPNAIQEKELLAAGRYTMRAPYFEIENEIVWGATAMMLNELRVILQEV